ncbi:family 2 glycosyl transferase [Caulobacter sp. D5]|uniref:glycosyltransferase family 2 protein n=3 Tax=unclassified Caulobacter TaxID=2648921 RepID=UPI000D736DD5|nr:glycosyltransferase family 2 protein [Caulobacter sp. D5]PXA96274.1 family 2 glycosyl transferase [Caulobacter sp. D5]
MAREDRRLHVEEQDHHVLADPPLVAPLPLTDGAHRRLSPGQGVALILVAVVLAASAALAPGITLAALGWTGLALFALLASLRLVAACTPSRPISVPPLPEAELPAYTVIAPLYKEASVAAELAAGLDRLDYPRDRLQALIMLEADDVETIAAFHALDLPAFIQVLVVPPGAPKTKPRACNHALGRARGELLVIYDAEDAPDPGQLREAAARFAAGPPDLACLQAPLRIEIPAISGFLPRQFQQEYAAHFEVLLPALARWRLAFPLGGTSNHFRVEALHAVGGWDAFNVTEDADVGFRLAAAGYGLDVIAPPTLETAPTSWKAWRPQRARWIKGHLQTLAVHLRGPAVRRPRVALALFLTLVLSLASTHLHAPIFAWVLLMLLLDLLPDGQAAIDGAGLVLFFYAWSASAIAAVVGRRRAGGRAKWLDLLGLPLIWLAQGWAGCHALVQFVLRPHHWDKTPHAPRAGRRLG